MVKYQRFRTSDRYLITYNKILSNAKSQNTQHFLLLPRIKLGVNWRYFT